MMRCSFVSWSYFFIRFIKTNSLKNFLFNIFLLMLLTKVLYVFTVYLLIIILFFFKKEKYLIILIN